MQKEQKTMKLTRSDLRKLIKEASNVQSDWQLLLNDWMQNWHQNKDIMQLFNDDIVSASPSQKKVLLRFRDAMQNMTSVLSELAIDHDYNLSDYSYEYKDDIDYSRFKPSDYDEEPDF